MSTIATDASVGRSEALRRSMVAMIEKGAPQEAHPAYWAPFVVVGEGGAPSGAEATTIPPRPETNAAAGPATNTGPVVAPASTAHAQVNPSATLSGSPAPSAKDGGAASAENPPKVRHKNVRKNFDPNWNTKILQ